MATEQKIREAIADIAARPRNVTLDEIEWVVKQLEAYFPKDAVRVRDTRHGRLYRIGSQTFMVNFHNPGSKQVKSYSVDDFIDAMTELGWYEVP